MFRAFLILNLVFTCVFSDSKAQVNGFEIESILVDACNSNEGNNELVRFRVGSQPLNTNNLQVTWATVNNPWGGVCSNPALVSQMNATITSCGLLMEPVNGILPANAKVLLVSGMGFSPSSISFANLSDTVFVIFNCSSPGTGNFANSGSGLRTLNMSFNGSIPCSDVATYDRSQLQGGDGSTVFFDPSGNASYQNLGCSFPGIPRSPSWVPPAPLCAGNPVISLNTLVTGTTGGTWSGNGVTNGIFSPAGLSGQVNITYTLPGNSCSPALSESHIISISAAPDPSWTPPATVCAASLAIDLNSLVTGATSGSWSGTNVSMGLFNPVTAGVYPVTYLVGTASCQATEVHSITVIAGPGDPSWLPFPVQLCVNEPPMTLDSWITGTIGGTWSGPGIIGNTFSPIGLSGEILLTYTLGQAGCIAYQSHSVFITPQANPAWNFTSSLLCTGSAPIDLNTLIEGDAGGTWTGPGVNNEEFNPTGLNGDIQLTYSVGSGACAASEVHTVSIVDLPVASFDLPVQICSSAPAINLNSTLTGTPGGFWTGTGVSANTFSPAGLTGSIEIRYTAGSGVCVATTTNQMLVVGSPDAEWVLPVDSICSDAIPIDLSALVNGALGGVFAGEGVEAGIFSPLGLTGSIGITYTVNSTGCSSFLEKNVYVTETPRANWTIPPALCSNSDPQSLYSWVTGTPYGMWNGEGVTDTIFSPQNVVGNVMLTYSVSVNGCSAVLSQVIQVTETPSVPIISQDQIICSSDQPLPFFAEIPTGSIAYWYGDEELANEVGSGTTFQPQAINGVQQFFVVASNAGCSSLPAVVQLTVNQSPEQPYGDTMIYWCTGSPLPLLSVESGFSVEWYQDEALTALLGTGTDFQTIDAGMTTIYAVSGNGTCRSNPLLIQILEKASAEATIIGDSVVYACLPQPVGLQSGHSSGNVWSTGETTSSISVKNSGWVYLKRVGACNTAIDSVLIADASVESSFEIEPVAGFTPATTSVHYTSENATSCEWYLNGVQTWLDVNNQLTFENDTSYTIELHCTNEYGCSSQNQTVLETGISTMYIPNAFTPGDDQVNPVFKPESYGMKTVLLRIYSRWGELIFQSSPQVPGWDGRSGQTVECMEGIYVYCVNAIDRKGKTHEARGTVQLLR